MLLTVRQRQTAGLVVCLAVVVGTLFTVMAGAAPDQKSKPANNTASVTTPVPEPKADYAFEPVSTTPPVVAVKDAPRVPKGRRPRPTVEPLTGARIATLRATIRQTTDFAQRRVLHEDLIYRCNREGLAFEAHGELEALLKDAAAESGPGFAHEVAYSECMSLMTRHWYEPAMRAFALMDNQYREGPHAEEISYQQGICQLEMKEYASAAALFEMVANTATSERLLGQALRKLAFAQLLKCDHDASLATLDRLESVGKGTELGEYAQMRRGVVLALANRTSEAIKAFEAFLKAHPGSRYGRVALRQMNELKKVQVASVK